MQSVGAGLAWFSWGRRSVTWPYAQNQSPSLGDGGFTAGSISGWTGSGGGASVANFTGGTSNGFSSAAFKTASVEFLAPPSGPLLGEPLGIRSSGAAPFTTPVDFDDVRTHASPVPLPAPAWLLGPVVACLGLFRRRGH